MVVVVSGCGGCCANGSGVRGSDISAIGGIGAAGRSTGRGHVEVDGDDVRDRGDVQKTSYGLLNPT